MSDSDTVTPGTCRINFPSRGRERRVSSGAVLAALSRALTARTISRAPWNASGWRPRRPLSHADLDRRVSRARETLEAYDALAARPRLLRPPSSDAEDAALMAHARGVAESTLAGDIADATLRAASLAATARRRKQYEAWDARVYAPSVDELAEAVDARAAARAARGLTAMGRAPREAEPPLVLRPAVPLTLRDPLKAARVKALEEDALTRPAGSADLRLPLARSRVLLPATFWSRQALSSTPHGYHLTQRLATGVPERLTASRVYHNDFAGMESLTCGPRGRLVELDAEWPRGKRVAVGQRCKDTSGVVKQERGGLGALSEAVREGEDRSEALPEETSNS